MISAMCGLGNPLTNASPDSTEGRMLAVVFASWQRAIGGTIVGLAGGIPILKATIATVEGWCLRVVVPPLAVVKHGALALAPAPAPAPVLAPAPESVACASLSVAPPASVRAAVSGGSLSSGSTPSGVALVAPLAVPPPAVVKHGALAPAPAPTPAPTPALAPAIAPAIASEPAACVVPSVVPPASARTTASGDCLTPISAF